MKEHLIFNIEIDEINLAKYLALLEENISSNTKCSICYTNAHVANLSSKDPVLLNTLNSFDINYADGFGLSIASKLP